MLCVDCAGSGCRREPEKRWHIQQVMECNMFKTGDDLLEQLQVCFCLMHMQSWAPPVEQKYIV